MRVDFRRIFTYLGQVNPDPEIREKQLLAAYRDFFATDQGKTILDDLANKFCFMDTTFHGDPTEAVFNEGSRNVVIYILGMIRDGKTDPIKEVLKL